MKKLHDDSEYYNDLSTKAKDYIEKKLSMDSVTTLINNRLEEIYKG